MIGHQIETPVRANQLCLILKVHKIAPRPVPNVFVMRSVIPEFRVGRNACSISIVRLTANPSVMLRQVARLIFPIAQKYKRKQKRSGIKPATLIPTSSQ